MSHHTNDPEKLVKLAKINAHHVSLFAYMMEKLQATPDGDGSLLDHSIYLLGSGMGNPDVHDHSNLPIVLAGGRDSQFKGGRHIKYEKPTPLANLHLTLLDKVGVHLDSFVDSTGVAISDPRNLLKRSVSMGTHAHLLPAVLARRSWLVSALAILLSVARLKLRLIDAVKANDTGAVRTLLDAARRCERRAGGWHNRTALGRRTR